MKPENKNLVEALGIASLPEVEQKEILSKIERRLEDVLLRVFAENLSEKEAEEAREILKKGEGIEDAVSEIASGIPRLAEKMEFAVAREIERLRAVLEGQ